MRGKAFQQICYICVMCAVEIPQFGVVRSLNVHVAGSLVLWQARQQQLLQSRSEK